MKKKIIKIVVILSFFVSLLIYFINLNNGSLITKKINSLKIQKNKNYSYIAHAGGGLGEKTYTNSKEALINSISLGYKLIELDLMVTADKYIFASHDLEIFNSICHTSILSIKDLYLKDIKKCKLKNNLIFTILTEDEINQVFLENKELILITDKIRDYKLLKKKFNFENRIIVETFSVSDYLYAKLIGIKNPMYYFKGRIINKFFISVFRPKIISISTKLVEEQNNFLKDYLKKKNLIFAFTSNNKQFNDKYLNNSISAVYTDFWDIDNSRCYQLKSKPKLCDKY